QLDLCCQTTRNSRGVRYTSGRENLGSESACNSRGVADRPDSQDLSRQGSSNSCCVTDRPGSPNLGSQSTCNYCRIANVTSPRNGRSSGEHFNGNSAVEVICGRG